MNTLERLRAAIGPMSTTELRALSERAGVPIHTLSKIRSGETPNPRIMTVDRLIAALSTSEAAA